MRLATYNVEWFNALFDDEGRLLEDRGWSARHDVRRAEQIAALGRVFGALDADAVMVIEAPDTSRGRDGVRALENFAARFALRARKALIGFANDTQQEIALLYDPDVIEVRHDPRGAPTGKAGRADAPRFDGVFRRDVDVDAAPERIRFSKPPLEVAARLRASGAALRLIGVHVKSKAPHGARTPDEAMRIAIENRRKQMAQCIWLRQRIEQHLAAGDDLIVLGDFNDGPGLDEYERLFGRSGIEVVLGEGDGVRLCEPHARMALGSPTGVRPVSARFWIREERRYFQALLDYIMLSPGLCVRAPCWRIWHPFDDPACYRDRELREALLAASDHFPVTLDLDI